MIHIIQYNGKGHHELRQAQFVHVLLSCSDRAEEQLNRIYVITGGKLHIDRTNVALLLITSTF